MHLLYHRRLYCFGKLQILGRLYPTTQGQWVLRSQFIKSEPWDTVSIRYSVLYSVIIDRTEPEQKTRYSFPTVMTLTKPLLLTLIYNGNLTAIRSCVCLLSGRHICKIYHHSPSIRKYFSRRYPACSLEILCSFSAQLISAFNSLQQTSQWISVPPLSSISQEHCMAARDFSK